MSRSSRRTPQSEIPHTVRRSSRARRVRVNVDAERGVVVVLPQRAPVAAAAEALSELRPWIERRLEELGRARAVIAARGATVPYLDLSLQLCPQQGRSRAHRSGSRLLVPADDPRRAIERFYRRAARREVADRLDRATAATGRPYRDLTIRAQRTRWASCSATGRMSFNWRLLLAPERILEYVVWHEVCHLEVLDHSPSFWALLQSRWPTSGEDRRWLARNGATLVL